MYVCLCMYVGNVNLSFIFLFNSLFVFALLWIPLLSPFYRYYVWLQFVKVLAILLATKVVGDLIIVRVSSNLLLDSLFSNFGLKKTRWVVGFGFINLILSPKSWFFNQFKALAGQSCPRTSLKFLISHLAFTLKNKSTLNLSLSHYLSFALIWLMDMPSTLLLIYFFFFFSSIDNNYYIACVLILS